jgi:uncharacterized membrane protein/membrane-bound inhibitor of C-type lysozyme
VSAYLRQIIAFTLFGGAIGGSGPAALAGGDGSGSASKPGKTFVYVCDDAEFVTRVEGDVAWLFSSTGTLRLPRVRSASGAKFENDRAMLWSKGEEALIKVAGVNHVNCRNNRRCAVWEDAKLRGADFRGVGNEPGWVLEISERTRITYLGDYGQTRLELRSGPPVENDAARQVRYTASDDTHRMSVVIEAASCRDSMSGEEFSSRVTVNLDGRELRGCGRPLH